VCVCVCVFRLFYWYPCVLIWGCFQTLSWMDGSAHSGCMLCPQCVHACVNIIYCLLLLLNLGTKSPPSPLSPPPPPSPSSCWSSCSRRRGLAKGEPGWPSWGRTWVYSSETSRWGSGWARFPACLSRRSTWVQRSKLRSRGQVSQAFKHKHTNAAFVHFNAQLRLHDILPWIVGIVAYGTQLLCNHLKLQLQRCHYLQCQIIRKTDLPTKLMALIRQR